MKLGRRRRVSYTDKLARTICDRIAAGGLITDICAEHGFPDYMTFRRWKEQRADFAENIARARAEQMDYYADQITKLNSELNAKNWQYKTAQIRNTQWLMGKLKACTYGERTVVAGDKNAPLGLTVISSVPRPQYDEDRPALGDGNGRVLDADIQSVSLLKD